MHAVADIALPHFIRRFGKRFFCLTRCQKLCKLPFTKAMPLLCLLKELFDFLLFHILALLIVLIAHLPCIRYTISAHLPAILSYFFLCLRLLYGIELLFI